MVLMSVGKKWIQKHNSTQTKTNFFSSESTGRYLDVFLVLEVVRCRVMHLARVGALFLAFRPGHGDERPSHCHFLNPRPSLLLWANPTSKTSFSFFPPSLSDFFTLFSLSLSFFLSCFSAILYRLNCSPPFTYQIDSFAFSPYINFKVKNYTLMATPPWICSCFPRKKLAQRSSSAHRRFTEFPITCWSSPSISYPHWPQVEFRPRSANSVPQ